MMNGNEGEFNHWLDHVADMIQDPACMVWSRGNWKRIIGRINVKIVRNRPFHID